MLRCSNLAKFAQPGDAVPEQQASLGQEALLARTHSVSLRTRLVLGAALLGAAALLTAGLLGEQYIGLSVGGAPEVLQDGDTIRDTQSALVLEELIQQFVSNMVSN